MTVETKTLYNGGGRKLIRHEFPTPEGEVEVSVMVCFGREAPSVRVFTYHDGEGPGTYYRIGMEKIIDGWTPHGEDFEPAY
jgi:hypothetical protein